ncbi:MAG: anthranilate synthase component I, partial [Microlunatus sp.]|nr:anthranilate synthase component I [Microlunatus sp.]
MTPIPVSAPPTGAIEPSLAEFRRLARDRRVISVRRRLLLDTETATGLYRKLAGDRPGTFLLESAEQGVWSRYSFIGVRAVATLTEVEGHAVWTGRPPVGMPNGGDPVEALAETLRLLHTPRDLALPPLTSGLVGYLSYDVVRRLERLPDDNPKDVDIPELALVLVGDLVVLDHHDNQVWLIANAFDFEDAVNSDDSDTGVDEAYADAVARVERLTAAVATPTPPAPVAVAETTEPIVRRQRTPAQFQSAVAAAVEKIKSGEAFQIVVSQRFEVDTTA